MGNPVNLEAPITFFGLGTAEYERDLNLIGQWWLDHRGGSWRPTHELAPPSTP